MMAWSREAAQFWKSHLSDNSPLLELPLDKTRPNERACFEFGAVSWHVAPKAAAYLQQLSEVTNVGVPALVLASYLAFLARVSRQDSLTVGCNPSSLLQAAANSTKTAQGAKGSSNRADSYSPEPSCNSITENDVDAAKHLVPFCTAVDTEGQSLQSLAASIAAGLAQMASHAHIPINAICEAVGVEPSPSYHPIYQAGFLLLPGHFSQEDVTAAAAATMHPMAASAGAISASVIRAALCQRSSSFSTSFSTAGLCPSSVAPLDLLLVLHGADAAAAGNTDPAGNPVLAQHRSKQGPMQAMQAHRQVDRGLKGVLAYSQDVLDPHMMELLAEHFQVFLSAACANPQAPLASLPMMSPTEQQQVLQAFNDTGVPPAMPSARGLLVHHQFMRQAAARPEAPCLVYEGEVLTYQQVDTASNQLANYLISSCGVCEGDVVGLMMQRSHNMMIAMLAILKAGAAYLPLDPGHPPSRTAFIVGDAGMKVIICQDDLAQLLPPASDCLAHMMLPQTGLGAVVSSAPGHSPGLLGRLRDLAYVIYTSGSTGNPKGVMVQHNNLVNFLAWEAEAFAHSPSDVFLQKTPTNFDVSIEELWTPLVTGAPLVIAKPNGHKDTNYLLDLINRHGVTNLSMVPSQIAMLLMEIEAGLSPCPSLKRILSAGEALTSSLARQAARVLPHVELVNAYGPTEATVYITHHTFDPREDNARPTVSIGKPLTNSKCYIVDKKNRLCPVGVPGELVVSGPQITRGYLNLPDKTAAVFVPNPYCAGAGTHTEVMYHTGDLARWLPCGRIECMGRTDHQVKLRGYRIELQEIESALVEQPGITAAVCCILKDPQGQARLVAYAEPSAGGGAQTLNRQALHASLAKRLPTYMVPEVLMVMSSLPRLSNEKLNRKALPEPDWVGDALGAAAAAAKGGGGGSGGPKYTTKQLAADSVLGAVVGAWGQALGMDGLSLGPKSDFMALGGNSLQAGLMAAAVRKALQLPRLSGLLIYTHSTLENFVSEVKQQAQAAAGANGPDGFTIPAVGHKDGQLGTASSGSSSSSDTAGFRDMLPNRSGDDSSACDGGYKQGASSASWCSRALPLWLASLLQLLAAAVCSGLQLAFNLAPILTVQLVMASLNEWTALAFIPVAKIVTLLSAVLLHVCVKWALVGRYKPGVHPIYGLHYVAWWIERLLFKNVQALLLPFIRGTALHNAYFRLLGARIAPNAVLDAEDVSEYDLVELQEGAYVGGNTVISPGNKQAVSTKQGIEAAAFPYGTFTHTPIVVGKDAVVGGLCVLAGPGASVAAGAVLPPNSSSTDSEALRRGHAMGPEGLKLADKPLGVLPALMSLLVLVLFESVMLVPATVGVMLLWDHLSYSTSSVSDTASSMLSCWAVPELQRSRQQQAQCTEILYGELLSVAAFGPMLLLSNVLLLFVFVVPLKWLVLGKVTGEKLQSRSSLRQWSIHTFVILQRSAYVRGATLLIQGTEVYNMLLRMLGYKIGRQCWLSNHNMSMVTPDMVTFGDTVSMGSDSHFYNATPTAAGPITFCDGVDVGHQATLFPGAVLQPGSVLGAKSNVMEGEVLPAGAIRLGCALLKGGKDLESGGKTDTTTNSTLVQSRLVSPFRYALCNTLLLLGNVVLIPLSWAMLSMPLFALVMVAVYEGSGMLVVPAVFMGFTLNFMVNVVWLAALRRLLLPSTAGVHPFYSSFFVRWNLWTGPFCVATMAYTPYFGSQLIIWFYRALGVSVGKNCCIGGGYSAEPDSFRVGDGCVLEAYSAASNHTIERRKVTISTIKLGDRVTLGVYGVMFPDTEAETGAVLDHCSVLLKGERAMAGTKWRGIPAEPVW